MKLSMLLILLILLPVLLSIIAYKYYRKVPIEDLSYGLVARENTNNSVKSFILKCIFGIPVFVIFIGILEFSNGYFNQGGLNAPSLSRLQKISGKMSKISMGRSWGIAVHDKTNGKKYTSQYAVCFYPTIANDFGKEVEVLINQESTFNKIYQLELDGLILINYNNRVLNDKEHIAIGTKGIYYGLFLLIIACICFFLMKKK